jgi:putative flippase GtrA
MKNFDVLNFVAWTFLFGLLLIPCLLAASGAGEGTLGSNFIWTACAKFFEILRFPTHTLFWSFIGKHPGFYFIGLAINCGFYGLLAERLISYNKSTSQDMNAKAKDK